MCRQLPNDNIHRSGSCIHFFVVWRKPHLMIMMFSVDCKCMFVLKCFGTFHVNFDLYVIITRCIEPEYNVLLTCINKTYIEINL